MYMVYTCMSCLDQVDPEDILGNVELYEHWCSVCMEDYERTEFCEEC